MPRVLDANRHERFDREIMSEMGELGFLGSTIAEEYGCAGVNYVSYGLIAREVERVDSGYRSAMSVQSSGDASDPRVRHRGAAAKYLPKLATGEWVGCFGLTEPDHGSDPADDDPRQSRAGRLPAARRQDVDHQFADRRCLRRVGQDRRRRHPRLHPRKGHEGLTAPKIEGKFSLRASHHRRDRDGRRIRPRGEPAAGRQGLAARSPASTARATGSPGARSARPSSAGMRRATTRSTAGSSAARSPPTS